MPAAKSDLKIRAAEICDCRRIAELYLVASDGVSEYIWSTIAAPGESLLDVGQRRYERDNADISYRNARVVVAGDDVVGMLVAYPMVVDPDYEEEDPVLRPYAILEEPDSYYVAAMAVDEALRGQGVGSRLLAIAEDDARKAGLDKMSLIVFDGNTGAKRLYLAKGYKEVNRERIVPNEHIHLDGDALLMVKQL